MMKVTQHIRSMNAYKISDAGMPRNGSFDKNLHKQGLKRLGGFTIRHGLTNEDFINNTTSVLIEAKAVRIPRILNPLYKRKKRSRVYPKFDRPATEEEMNKAFTREGVFNTTFKYYICQ